MTDNMVERVARAICLADGEDPDERCEDWMREFSGWRGYVESARAAIAAMRDYMEAKHGHSSRYFHEAFLIETDAALATPPEAPRSTEPPESAENTEQPRR